MQITCADDKVTLTLPTSEMKKMPESLKKCGYFQPVGNNWRVTWNLNATTMPMIWDFIGIVNTVN